MALPSIRQFESGDLELSRRLRLAALADAPQAFAASLEHERSMPESEWRDRLASSVEGVATVGFFALVDGKEQGLVVGVYRPGTPAAAELVSMWLAPPARGLGAGVALVQAVLDWARQRGCARVGLSVRQGNEAAIALYRRCGFAQVGERPDFLADHEMCEVYMVRELAA